jgi:outer membrane protein assembly factor BamB
VGFSDGRTKWRKPLNEAVVWAAYGPLPLLLGTNDWLFAVTLETGQTLWQTALGDPDDGEAAHSPPQFQLAGERLLVLQSHQVTCYDANNGRLVWRKEAINRFGRFWHADEEFIVVQNEDPPRVSVLETKTGQRLSEHNPPAPWAASPLAFQSPPPRSLKGTLAKNRGFIAALESRRIHAFGAYDPKADPAWIYQGANSIANAPPWFCFSGENLLMLLDGDTLIKLEPSTGETAWFAQVSLSPLASPTDNILLNEDRVSIAGSQSLTCLDLKTGKPAWQDPLPEAGAWLLRKNGPVLLAVPFQSENSSSQAILFEAQNGKRIQTLPVPPLASDAVFQSDGLLIVAKGKLTGFGPYEFSAAPN